MPESLVGRVIHIVEGDNGVRDSLSRLMRSAGFEARAFATPEQFLAEVRCGASGCMLVDMSAYAACSGLDRAQLREKGIDLPAIALSATDNEMDRRVARRLGAKLLLRKPVDDQALLDAINWVLEALRDDPGGQRDGQK